MQYLAAAEPSRSGKSSSESHRNSSKVQPHKHLTEVLLSSMVDFAAEAVNKWIPCKVPSKSSMLTILQFYFSNHANGNGNGLVLLLVNYL
jgi:hypothetical protein